MSLVNRVWKFGCRAPREPALALQLLGQAWLYEDDLRRIYRAQALAERERRAGLAEASHVLAWEEHLAALDEVGHVLRWRHVSRWADVKTRTNAAIRRARRQRGHLLDCGTYWLVEAAVQSAAKSGSGKLRTRPFDGTGRIGAAIHARDQFAAAEWPHPRVSLTRPDARGHALLTIGIGVKSAGHTITWPIKLHRTFPPEAVVKQVAVQRTRCGHRFRWEALVTIATDESTMRDAGATGVVGIDIGWRDDGEVGYRVATHDAQDDVGVLHIDTRDAFLYADAVRSIRDVTFDEAKTYAKRAGLAGAEHAHMWRDKARLVRLAERTSDLGAVWWRARDRHLEDIECGVRSRAIRRRLDAFRRYADSLAKRYLVVALEDMPMADWVGRGETSTLERRRSSAALYLLQITIAHRFGPSRVDWVPAEYSTMTCAKCGVVRSDPVGPGTHWDCVCGAVHHQDENAAEVLRSRCERWTDDGNPVRARKRRPSRHKGKKGVVVDDIVDTDSHAGTARNPVAAAAE